MGFRFSLLVLRLRRAWCALAHAVEPYRGSVRCPQCQPEVHRRRVNVLGVDITPVPHQETLPIEPERELPA